MILMLQRDILSDRFWTPRLLHTGRSICWVVPVFCPCRWTTLPRWPGWRPLWRPLWRPPWRPPWRPLGFGFGRWAWRQRFRPWAVPAEGRSRHCLGFPGGRETSASCSYDWPTRGERERRSGWGREYGEEREMCEEEGAIQSALFFKLKHVVCLGRSYGRRNRDPPTEGSRMSSSSASELSSKRLLSSLHHKQKNRVFGTKEVTKNKQQHQRKLFGHQPKRTTLYARD